MIAALEFLFLFGCALLAYKTRTIPDDFNESQLVAIATYNACFLKIFNTLLQSMSSAQQNLVIQLIGSNIEVFLSYFVTVIVIFAPKLKSVYVQKHPNDTNSPASSGTSNSQTKDNPSPTKDTASSKSGGRAKQTLHCHIQHLT
ncbi:hypothetical protein BJ742DRAFT_44579 [Cladochytrium replicatum]|nr:hypothetical protein BJ742DRAFT_44579 [Cladochytrium replicatum]